MDREADPAPVGALILGAASRLSSAVTGDGYQARAAEARRAQERREREALRLLCDEREIPGDEDLRRVVYTAHPQQTVAMVSVGSALAWRGGKRRGLVLLVSGDRGAGKSCAAAWHLARYAGSGAWVRASTVAATKRNGWSTCEALWQRWLEVGLLVVDDLGVEGGTGDDLGALLLERYDLGRATIATTNLDKSALVARYLRGTEGERLADRILGAQGRIAVGEDGRRRLGPGGQTWLVACEGASMRGVR